MIKKFSIFIFLALCLASITFSGEEVQYNDFEIDTTDGGTEVQYNDFEIAMLPSSIITDECVYSSTQTVSSETLNCDWLIINNTAFVTFDNVDYKANITFIETGSILLIKE